MASAFMESLVDRITTRFRVAAPVVPTNTTSEVQPDTGDLEKELPLGFSNGAWDYYNRLTKAVAVRRDLYDRYDEMDAELPEFSSSMNIYADNATRGDSDGTVRLTVKSKDTAVQGILTDVRDRVNLEGLLWPLARDIAKYGERAVEVIVDENFNIVRLKPLPTAFIFPQYDENGVKQEPFYKQVDAKGETVAEYEEWQVLYFANVHSLADITGTGLGRSALRAWKQLRMMEDAVVIARLTRAHNRIAYLVDTGHMTPVESQKHLNKLKAHLAKRRIINPATGRMDTESNPLAVEQDIFVATNKESKADVKILQGDLTVGNLADLEYFQQKIFTTLQVPKPYLAHEKDTRAKNIVTAQDIQFARAVRRIQQVMQEGFTKLFDLALVLRGKSPKKAQYLIGLPVISIVDDLRVWQTEQLKMLVAQMFKMVFWPTDEWILTHLLAYDSDDVAELLKGQVKPDKFNGLYQAPKIGATASNVKVGSDENFKKLFASLNEADQQVLTNAMDNLRALSDWSLDGARQQEAA